VIRAITQEQRLRGRRSCWGYDIGGSNCYRIARRQDAACDALVVPPDDWHAFSSAEILAALVLQPAVLQAFSMAATLAELTLQPEALQAFSTLAIFAELTALPEVLQAFAAAATSAEDTLYPLQARNTDAA